MLEVTFHNDGFIVQGHAEYAEYGQDIVCASVSVLAQAVANEIKEYTSANIQKSSGYLFVLAEKDLASKILLDMFYRNIREIARQYPKNVKIRNNFSNQ